MKILHIFKKILPSIIDNDQVEKVEKVIANSPLMNVAEIVIFSLIVILLIILISVLILSVYTLFIKKDILTVWNKDIGISLRNKKFKSDSDNNQEIAIEYITRSELNNLENKYITKEEFEQFIAKYVTN